MSEPSKNEPSESSSPIAFETKVYVQQALQLLELNVPLEQLPSLVENFHRIHRIAQPVLDFPLPDDLEAAPQFEP